jgi:hypothetical protein
LGYILYLAVSLFFLMESAVVQAATVEFKTREVWQSPRFYYFFNISEDFSSMTLLAGKKSATSVIPFQRIDTSCTSGLKPEDLHVRTTSLQEILLSTDRRWIALRVKEPASDLSSLFENIVLEFHVQGSLVPCILKVNSTSFRGVSPLDFMPSIVFTGAEHRYSDQEFRISEDFLVASIRYRFETSTGLRRVTSENVAVTAVVLSARGSFWSNRLSYLGADLQVLQSIQSFPKDLSNAEWALSLNSRLHWAHRGLEFSLKPHLGMRQQLLLSEVDISLPQGSRSVSLLQVGATIDIEFSERWLIRGRGEYGFKEFDQVQGALVDWKSRSIETALGYRLRSELRLLLEAGVHDISRASEVIRKLDLVRLGVEMDF